MSQDPNEESARAATSPRPTLDRNAYAFQTEVRVRLSETDAVGIVFFGSYSAYMDVGRMDYLNHLGLQRFGTGEGSGRVRDLIPGAVVGATLEFKSPARYNDVLTVNTRIAHLGRTSYQFHFLIGQKRSREIAALGTLTLVWLDDTWRPQPLPEEFTRVVRSFEGPNLSP